MMADLLAIVSLVASLLINSDYTFKIALLIFSFGCCVSSVAKGILDKKNAMDAVATAVKDKSEDE